MYEDEDEGLTPQERALKELRSRRSENDLNLILVTKLKDLRAREDDTYGKNRHTN